MKVLVPYTSLMAVSVGVMFRPLNWLRGGWCVRYYCPTTSVWLNAAVLWRSGVPASDAHRRIFARDMLSSPPREVWRARTLVPIMTLAIEYSFPRVRLIVKAAKLSPFVLCVHAACRSTADIYIVAATYSVQLLVMPFNLCKGNSVEWCTPLAKIIYLHAKHSYKLRRFYLRGLLHTSPRQWIKVPHRFRNALGKKTNAIMPLPPQHRTYVCCIVHYYRDISLAKKATKFHPRLISDGPA